MDIGCVEVSIWILVVLRLVLGLWLYGGKFMEYWLCGGKCMDIGCVEVSVWILVVLRLVYDIGCVETSVWILVVLRLVYGYWLC